VIALLDDVPDTSPSYVDTPETKEELTCYEHKSDDVSPSEPPAPVRQFQRVPPPCMPRHLGQPRSPLVEESPNSYERHLLSIPYGTPVPPHRHPPVIELDAPSTDSEDESIPALHPVADTDDMDPVEVMDLVSPTVIDLVSPSSPDRK
jgi:hypothetical protein